MKTERKAASNGPVLPGPMQQAFQKVNLLVVKDTEIPLVGEQGRTIEEDQIAFGRQLAREDDVPEMNEHVHLLGDSHMTQSSSQYKPVFPLQDAETGALVNVRRRIFDYMVPTAEPLTANQIALAISAEGLYSHGAVYSEVDKMKEMDYFEVFIEEGSHTRLQLKDRAAVPDGEYSYYRRQSKTHKLKGPLIPKKKMTPPEVMAKAREARALKILRGDLLPSGRKPQHVKDAEEKAKKETARMKARDKKDKEVKASEPKVAKTGAVTQLNGHDLSQHSTPPATPSPATNMAPIVAITKAMDATEATATIEALKNHLRKAKGSEVVEALKSSLSVSATMEVRDWINSVFK